jgi:glyoxylase-like metal-dependent hydrolase (beta-lactamase superfamily II)
VLQYRLDLNIINIFYKDAIMIFYQLFEHESSTYTYLLGDENSKEAVLIDPVYETVERDLKLISELELKLKYTIETHVHADHITGAYRLKEKTGSKTIVSKYAQIECSDIKISDGDIIRFGNYELKALETQGHTNSCMSYVIGNKVFTGDLLFIRGTGRTDFQQGNPKLMFHNIRSKIFTLPSTTLIYPGHDYKGMTYTTVEQEINYNPRVGKNISEEQFIKIMNELKLAEPKKLSISMPANLKCGQIN